MPELGLNIDHVATLREARYRDWKRGLPPEPGVLEAARLAEQAGVDAITVHLREDRRHIQEADVRDLSRVFRFRLNLEMAATPAMTRQALRFKPEEVCLVPENRQEITTEGGLDVAADITRLKGVIAKLHSAKIEVSAFIDAEPDQVEAAHRVGAQTVEFHTGTYANATTRDGVPEGAGPSRAGGGFGARNRLAGQCRTRPPLLQCPRVHRGCAASAHAEHRARAIIARAVFVGLGIRRV